MRVKNSDYAFRSSPDKFNFAVLLPHIRDRILEEHRIQPQIRPQQRHIPKNHRKRIQARLSLYEVVGIVPRRPPTHRGLLLVLLPLRHFDGRPPRHVRDQKIHQNILAILTLLHRFVQQRAQPLGVQNVVISVVERGTGQDYRVIVRPLGSVAPRPLCVVPEVGPGRIADYPVRELLPHLEREIHLVRGERRVFVQREHGGGSYRPVRVEPLRNARLRRV